MKGRTPGVGELHKGANRPTNRIGSWVNRRWHGRGRQQEEMGQGMSFPPFL